MLFGKQIRKRDFVVQIPLVIHCGLDFPAHIHERNGKPFVSFRKIRFVTGIEKTEPSVRRKRIQFHFFVNIRGKRGSVGAGRIHRIALVEERERAEIIPLLKTFFYAFEQKFVAEIQLFHMVVFSSHFPSFSENSAETARPSKS